MTNQEYARTIAIHWEEDPPFCIHRRQFAPPPQQNLGRPGWMMRWHDTNQIGDNIEWINTGNQ